MANAHVPTPATRALVVDLLRRGFGPSAIARRVGISRATLLKRYQSTITETAVAAIAANPEFAALLQDDPPDT